MRLRGRLATALVCAFLVSGGPACRRHVDPSPSPGGTLSVLLASDLTSLDPQTTFDDVSSVVLGNVYEPLVGFDESFRVVPGLAVRWINPDDRTWRFHLDEQARFANGQTLRADDVKFSIERARSVAGSQLSGFVRHVTSVSVLDDRTVDVHTDAPMAILNALAFVPILSEAHARAAGDAGLAETSLGTGPYRVSHWERGRVIVLEASAQRAVRPSIQRVEIALRPDGEVLEELRRTRPHLALFLTRREAAEFAGAPAEGLELRTAPALAVYYLGMNTRPRLADGSPNVLHDVRARRAVAHALEREPMVREALLGYGLPATQLVASQVFGYDPALRPPAEDLEAARAALAAAGLHSPELALTIAAGGTHRLENILVSQLARAGIRTKRLERRPDELAADLAQGRAQMAVQGYGCTSGDASEFLTFGLHGQHETHAAGPGNFAAYRNAELDRIVDTNLHVLDPRARLRLLQRALRLANEDAPYVPLLVAQDVHVVSRALAWRPPVTGEVRIDTMRLAPAPR